MTALERSFIALIVVSAGVAAALPFQRQGPQLPSAPEQRERQGELRWRNPNIVLQIAGGQETSPAQLDAGPAPQPSPARIADTRASDPPRRPSYISEVPLPLPEVPPEFETLEPVEPPRVPLVEVRAAPRADELPLVEIAPEPPQPRREIRHVLTDGDTLPKLAQRYLGDASKWIVIYEANRDLLSDPDLLPLGVELRFPE